jgi:hypothetical protein
MLLPGAAGVTWTEPAGAGHVVAANDEQQRHENKRGCGPQPQQPPTGRTLRSSSGIGVPAGSGRFRGTDGSRYRRDQPVAALAYRCNVGGRSTVITQHTAKLRNRLVDGRIDDIARPPDVLDQRVGRHHLARSIGKVHKGVHRLGLDVDAGVAARQPVERGLDQPVPAVRNGERLPVDSFVRSSVTTPVAKPPYD